MGKTVFDVLSKDKRYIIFMDCLKKIGIDNILKLPNITLFIPINLAFINQINNLNKCDLKQAETLLKSHIVSQNIKMLQIGKTYSTLNKKNIIKITGKNILNGNIRIAGQPIGTDNGLIYFIDKIIFPQELIHI